MITATVIVDRGGTKGTVEFRLDPYMVTPEVFKGIAPFELVMMRYFFQNMVDLLDQAMPVEVKVNRS